MDAQPEGETLGFSEEQVASFFMNNINGKNLINIVINKVFSLFFEMLIKD